MKQKKNCCVQGNITFALDEEKVSINGDKALNDAAHLLSVSPSDLQAALIQRIIAAGGEVMQKTHTLTEAEYGRDALAKVLLNSRVFKR